MLLIIGIRFSLCGACACFSSTARDDYAKKAKKGGGGELLQEQGGQKSRRRAMRGAAACGGGVGVVREGTEVTGGMRARGRAAAGNEGRLGKGRRARRRGGVGGSQASKSCLPLLPPAANAGRPFGLVEARGRRARARMGGGEHEGVEGLDGGGGQKLGVSRAGEARPFRKNGGGGEARGFCGVGGGLLVSKTRVYGVVEEGDREVGRKKAGVEEWGRSRRRRWKVDAARF